MAGDYVAQPLVAEIGMNEMRVVGYEKDRILERVRSPHENESMKILQVTHLAVLETCLFGLALSGCRLLR
jgi:hypothetical protein